MEQHIAQLIALLFTAGEGASPARLSSALNVSAAQLTEIITAAEARTASIGLQLHVTDKQVRLATHPDVAGTVREFVGEELKSNLSKSALETITIVLYKGPISRSAIDYIRGVNSTYALQSLVARGLIERHVNPKDARSFVYTVSDEFLRYLGVMSVSELPSFAGLAEAKNEEIAAAISTEETESHDENR